jgi:chloramphenicol O-acetyltransferase
MFKRNDYEEIQFLEINNAKKTKLNDKIESFLSINVNKNLDLCIKKEKVYEVRKSFFTFLLFIND